MPEIPQSDELIDLHDLIVSLDPAIQGQFEPLSGLMRLNVAQDDYLAAFQRFAANASSEDDRDLIHTINHETFHALQAATSGYAFDRQRRLFAALNTPEPIPELQPKPQVQASLDQLFAAAGEDPKLLARAQRAKAVVYSQMAIEYFDAVAMPGDNSIFGALHPAFFRFQDRLAQAEALPNSGGLSILGIVEGSAVAYAHQIMRPHAGAEQAMLAEFATTPPIYRQLYDFTTQRVAARAFELLLPTAALAISYSAPHQAYAPLLDLLAQSPTGGALSAGETLAANLPAIPAAGPILGTAVQVRRADPSFPIYDSFLDALDSKRWPFTPYALLADPTTSNLIDTLPLSVVTNEEFQRLPSAMTFEQFAGRLYLLSLVMRKFSRRLEELHIRQLQLEWAQDVLNNPLL